MNWKLIGIVGAAVVAAFVLGLMVAGDDAAGPAPGSTETTTAKVAEVWTCSMHPQIKLPKAGKCPICFMDLIPLNKSGGEEVGPRQIRVSETARKLAQIQTAPVIRGTAGVELRLLGKLAVDETRLAKITARAAGRVDKLHVDFTGQAVRKDEELASIYSPELFSAQQELIQAKASAAALGGSESEVLRGSAAANLVAAREKLRLLGFAPKQIAAIEASGTPSDHLTITAPLSGTVIEKMVQEGQYVEMGMELYAIADLARLWVLIDAYEADLGALALGDRVKFNSAAFPGESFEATINFINPTVDPMTRTIGVRGTIANTRGLLKPEMFLSAELGSAAKAGSEEQLLIPITAPLVTGRRAVVYVEMSSDDGSIFEGREVELGPKSGQYYVVKSGLAEGEMVVVNGAFKLDSELQIQAKPSMMSPTVGAANAQEIKSKPAPEKQVVKLTNDAYAALQPLYDRYFELQMALAQDDLARAQAAAKAVAQANGAINMNVFSGPAHELWMKFTEVIGKESDRLGSAENFEKARDAFFFLSDAMVDLHASFGHGEKRNYYLTFCPMAREGKGAFWLQTVDTVWNSFYGDAMLRCGEIRDTLEPAADN